MPTTVNGTGLSYCGRSNALQRRGRCDACGCYAALRSYDTQLVVTLIMIPIIPLRWQRVLDECPACLRHRRISLKKWNAGREELMAATIPQVEQQPTDGDALREALLETIMYQRPELIGRLGMLVEQYHTQDAQLHHLVGGAFQHFTEPVLAKPFFERAHELEPTDEYRLSLALNAIELSEPDHAWDLLQEKLAERDQERGVLLLAVAEAYQTFGMHQAAMTVLNAATEVDPGLSKLTDYKRINRRAIQNLKTEKPFEAVIFAPLKPFKTEHVAANQFGRLAPLGIALALVVFYLGMSLWQGANREVWFVNGLNEPYTVSVGAHTRTLHPGRAVALKLAEGRWEINVSDGPPIEPQEFEFGSNFWARPFLAPTYVVNPDRTALVEVGDVGYAVIVAAAADPNYRLFVGDLARTYWDVDFKFHGYPDEIELPHGKPTIKRGLRYADDYDVGDFIFYVQSTFDYEQAESILIRCAALSGNSELLYAVRDELGDETFLAVTAASRRIYPPRLTLHRTYQEILKREGHHDEVLAEYQALHEAHPECALSKYLLAEVSDDLHLRKQLFAEAAENKHLFTRAHAALIYTHLCAGEIETAAKLARVLDREIDWDTEARLVIAEALLAGGECYTAAVEYKRLIEGEQYDSFPIYDQMCAHLLAGDPNAAQASLDAVMKLLQEHEVEELSVIRMDLEANLAYMQADTAAVRAAIAKETSLPLSVELLEITAADPNQALAGLAKVQRPNFEQALLILALVGDRYAVHAASCETALSCLRDSESVYQRFATWWRGEQTPSVSQLQALPMPPRHKRVALAALGQRFPDLRSACFELARKLNYHLLYPHQLVERITATNDDERAGG